MGILHGACLTDVVQIYNSAEAWGIGHSVGAIFNPQYAFFYQQGVCTVII
jgi:hypothetical protein